MQVGEPEAKVEVFPNQVRYFLWLWLAIALVACGAVGGERKPTTEDTGGSENQVETTPGDESPDLSNDGADANYPAPVSGDSTAGEAYPPRNTAVIPTQGAYPPPGEEQVPTPVAYPPAVTPQELQSGTILALDRPIKAGDTRVSGVGPAGLPIFVLNITFMGEIVGSGIVGDDGTFSIPVEALEPGSRLGLTADIQGYGLTSEDVGPGEGEISVPQVGYFFDSTMILEN